MSIFPIKCPDCGWLIACAECSAKMDKIDQELDNEFMPPINELEIPVAEIEAKRGVRGNFTA